MPFSDLFSPFIFFFFRKIFIPFMCFFWESFFVFLMIFIYHFYIYKNVFIKSIFYKLENNMRCINNINYVNNMGYANNMSHIRRLYELHELRTLYEYFHESLKLTWNRLIFVFKKFGFFLLIYKDGKLKL